MLSVSALVYSFWVHAPDTVSYTGCSCVLPPPFEKCQHCLTINCSTESLILAFTVLIHWVKFESSMKIWNLTTWTINSLLTDSFTSIQHPLFWSQEKGKGTILRLQISIYLLGTGKTNNSNIWIAILHKAPGYTTGVRCWGGIEREHAFLLGATAIAPFRSVVAWSS